MVFCKKKIILIFFSKGPKTEGVFRIPAFPNELKELKERIDK